MFNLNLKISHNKYDREYFIKVPMLVDNEYFKQVNDLKDLNIHVIDKTVLIKRFSSENKIPINEDSALKYWLEMNKNDDISIFRGSVFTTHKLLDTFNERFKSITDDDEKYNTIYIPTSSNKDDSYYYIFGLERNREDNKEFITMICVLIN